MTRALSPPGSGSVGRDRKGRARQIADPRTVDSQALEYDIRQSNGPLSEVNSHDIDTLRWFSGAEFEEVYAVAGNYRSPDARERYPDFYDNVLLVASFENDMQGLIDGAASVRYGYDARVEVLGTRGIAFVGELRGNSVAGVHRRAADERARRRKLARPLCRGVSGRGRRLHRVHSRGPRAPRRRRRRPARR